jgi:hypothetical protein
MYTSLIVRDATGRQPGSHQEEYEALAPGDFVDWRGNTINKKVHGGVRAAWFLYGKSP